MGPKNQDVFSRAKEKKRSPPRRLPGICHYLFFTAFCARKAATLSLSLSLSLSCCHADCSARERRTRRTRSVLHPRYVVVRERIEPTRGVGSRSSKIGGRRAKRAYASEWLHVVTGLSLVHSSFLWVQRRASIVSRRLLVETK